MQWRILITLSAAVALAFTNTGAIAQQSNLAARQPIIQAQPAQRAFPSPSIERVTGDLRLNPALAGLVILLALIALIALVIVLAHEGKYPLSP